MARVNQAPMSTRRTRSQSREVSAEPQLASRQAEGDSEGRSTRNTRQNTRPTTNKQLETLREDISEAEDYSDEQPDYKQSRAGSLSQKTADDTFSQSELRVHDPDKMEANLEILNAQARKLLGYFRLRTGNTDEKESLIRDVQDTDSPWREEIDTCRNSLDQTQRFFTQSEYLDPSIILRGLLGLRYQPLPKANRPWRPDDVICKANLAILVHFVMTHFAGEQVVDSTLETLDQRFPELFVLGFGHMAGYSTHPSETFDFALELRTHMLVSKLALEPHLSHEDAVSMIQRTMFDFDEEDDSGLQSLADALHEPEAVKGWGSLLVPQTFEDGRYADLIIERTREIRDLLCQDVEDPHADYMSNLDSGVNRLQERFPWKQFQVNLLQWANLRLNEIDNNIKRVGGIDEIVNALEMKRRLDNPDDSDEDDLDADEALPKVRSHVQVADATPASSTKQRARPIALFKGRPRPPAGPSVLNAAPAEQLRTTIETDFGADDARDSETASRPEPRPNKLAGRFAMASARDQKERQERRSIMDPQPNAIRVSWDDEPGQSQATARRTGFRLPGTANPRLDEDEVEDPSQDSGFQQDTRVVATNRPRPRPVVAPIIIEPALEGTASPKRRLEPSESVSPPKRPRANPGQALEPLVMSGHDLADAAAQASLKAKMNIRKALPKPQRGRKAWTPQEDQALLAYIGACGDGGSIPYAFIKKTDEVEEQILRDRDAEDMRSRSRIMKMDFLISGQDLPKNMEHVKLGKKEIERVRSNNVEYEQVASRSRSRILSP